MQGQIDARGMRHAAAQLRSKADHIATIVNRLDAQVAPMAYAGPAADHFRNVVAAEQHRLRETLRVLAQMADVLSNSAAAVEADPARFYGAERP